MSKDLASLPYWFNEDEMVEKLGRASTFTQDELETLVVFYSTYQYRGDGFWEAFIKIQNHKYKIRYFRVEGERVYEQPEVM